MFSIVLIDHRHLDLTSSEQYIDVDEDEHVEDEEHLDNELPVLLLLLVHLGEIPATLYDVIVGDVCIVPYLLHH